MLRRLFVFGTVALGSLCGLFLAHPSAITAIDQEQPRLNQAAPVPQGAAVLEQTFRAGHNGLSSIDLLAVAQPDGPPNVTLTVRLLDSAGHLVASEVLAGVAHNAPLHLSFSPQPVSAGQSYILQLIGSPGNKTTVWAYSLDGYPDGALRFSGVLVPGAVRFSTSYTYQPADALSGSLAAAGRLVGMALPIWVVLFAPGLLVVDLAGYSQFAWPARWATALALSVSLLAIGWLWIGVIGLRWSPVSLGVLYAAVGAVVGVRFVWRGWQALRARRRGAGRQWPVTRLFARTRHDSALALILVVCLASRFLAIRDLAFPPWVDSSHHLAIARLLAETGQVPPSYAPVLPIPRFQYHFGFHALAVTLAWFTDQALTDTFLWLGQLLQGLVPLALYAAVFGMTGRRRAALMAAFFAGLVSFFPGYYATWGRYTQLTGLIILGPAMAEARRAGLVTGTRRVARWASAGLTGLLAAGLLLAHYPLFVMWLVFAAVACLFARRAGWQVLAGAAVAGGVAALPWLWRLGNTVALLYSRSPQPLAAQPGYNAFPWEYFNSSVERGWIVAATAMLAWGLLRRDRVAWATAGWMALLAALVNVGPGNWLVNNNTLATSLFVPGAIALGWGADHWLSGAMALLRSKVRPTEISATATASAMPAVRGAIGVSMILALSGAAGYAGVLGVQAQVGVINPSTILATAADRQGLDWVAKQLPTNAVILVNGWEWLNGTWAGSDGGAWIWPLTGRHTTLPPVDYAYSDPESQRLVNAFNARVAQATDANAPEFRALLARAGVTHIYIGAHGGPLKPEMFVGTPYYRLLYSNGAAWVFLLAGPPT